MFRFVRDYRVILAALLGLSMFVAACGSDGDTTAADNDSSADTEAADSGAEADDTEADDDGETHDDSDDDSMAESDSEAILIDLGNPSDGEFSLVVGSDGLTGGSLTFNAVNNGENPHAFAIARGTSYEDLPQKDNGAVDTDALGADYLGTTANLQSGEEESITFDLEAGDYVFFCPVEFGPNSHAKAGQVLSVSVG